MGYELKKLSASHHAIIRLKLRGYTNLQIAKMMDMAEVSISLITNSGVFQQELARRMTEIEKIENEQIGNGLNIARAALEREALPSVMALAECRDSGDPNLKRQAAKDILGLAFARENSSPSGGQLAQVVVMNAQNIAFLNQVVKEAGLNGDRSASGSGAGTNGESTQSDGDRELQATG